MAEKKAKQRGPFFQTSGVDPELARKFRGICKYRGEDVGELLSTFMREYVAAHGPKEPPKKPK